jgi:hypothetical protein
MKDLLLPLVTRETHPVLQVAHRDRRAPAQFARGEFFQDGKFVLLGPHLVPQLDESFFVDLGPFLHRPENTVQLGPPLENIPGFLLEFLVHREGELVRFGVPERLSVLADREERPARQEG